MIHDRDKPESDPDNSNNPPNDVQDAPGEPGGHAPAEAPIRPPIPTRGEWPTERLSAVARSAQR